MTQTSFPDMKIMAKPVIVAYESSDQAVLAAAAKTVGAAGSSATVEVAQNDSLSGGTIAGIAIGSAIGGVLIATVLTFIFLRFCLGYRRMHSHEAHRTSAKAYEVEGAAKQELESSDGGTLPRTLSRHADSQRSLHENTNELPSFGRSMSGRTNELASVTSPVGEKPELDGGGTGSYKT